MGQYAGSDIVLESNSLLRAVFFIPKNKERQVNDMKSIIGDNGNNCHSHLCF